MLMTNRGKYEFFIHQTDEFYHEIEKMKDPLIKETIETLTKRARILTVFNFGVGIVFSTYFCIYPLFGGETRRLPYGLFIPGFDVYKSPAYEIIYVIEVFLL